MDNHTQRVLEFEKILRMTAAHAVTVPGRAVTGRTGPVRNVEEIREQIELVSECRRVISEGRTLGIDHIEDLMFLFRRLKPEDAVLEPLELRTFLPLFYSACNLKLIGDDHSLPRIGRIVSHLTTHPDVRKAIDAAIDREGKISDNASPALFHIRKSIKSFEVKIKRILEDILKRKELAVHLQDNYITERNNRWVVPVKSDSKGSVPGVIHDISNTGETVFVEPYASQQIGNELESLKAEEKLEEFRVLQALSSLLRSHLGEIEADYHIVARVDSVHAFAGFAEQMHMSPPVISENAHLKIVNARHPLLWKTLRSAGREKDVVPLNLELGSDNRCVVITGSNAGGKTVALKTIGIVTLMALSGMHTPADSGTTIPFLDKVLADIGDEQSIEQNLSTFSAHMSRIAEIVREGGAHTLVIIDELGTGTDPEQGGALSCAVLRRLTTNGAITVVSTHLGVLKAFAHTEPGLMNSAMEMEEVHVKGVSTYRPTYKLITGEPGTSHAFEIAESLGLNEDVIREARAFVTGEGLEIDSLISELKQKSGELDRRLAESETLRREVNRLRLSLHNELSMIDMKTGEALKRALSEAEAIVRKTRREAFDIIESLKQSTLRDGRKIIKGLDRKVSDLKREQAIRFPGKAAQLKDVREGKRVFIDTLAAHGVIHSVHKKTGKCRVSVEGKEITLRVTDLSEPKANADEERGRGTLQRAPADKADDMYISPELNVIGERVDPALSRVERFLNDVSVAGLNQVRIIHGIGSGILSRAIREYLTGHPLVEKWRRGEEDEGGEAVTVVFF